MIIIYCPLHTFCDRRTAKCFEIVTRSHNEHMCVSEGLISSVMASCIDKSISKRSTKECRPEKKKVVRRMRLVY